MLDKLKNLAEDINKAGDKLKKLVELEKKRSLPDIDKSVHSFYNKQEKKHGKT